MFRRYAGVWLGLLTLGSLCSRARALDFSPDGRQIVFASTAGAAIINVDGTGLLNLPGAAAAVTPSWAPDGRSIVFTDGDHALKLYDTASRAIRALGKGYVPAFAWREDGRRLAAVHVRDDGAKEVVWYNLPEAGVSLRVTVPVDDVIGGRMVWLPNTDDVAFLGRSGNNTNVYSIEAGEVKRLTTSNDVLGLALAPGGKRLLWARRGPNLKYILLSIFAYDLTARNVTPVSFPYRVGGLNPDPRHAPLALDAVGFAGDGRHLSLSLDMPTAPASASKEGRHVRVCYTVPIDGKNARPVRTTEPVGIGVPAPAPDVLLTAWSRDGAHLAILDTSGGQPALVLFSADGTGGRKLWGAGAP